jgi:tRNA A37 threonylcarbamoyladenosine dehydratase
MVPCLSAEVKRGIKMAKATLATPDQPIGDLTIGDLQKMITETVRQVVREELSRDYYINEEGFKVLYEEEDIDPDYLAQLNKDYEDIEAGRTELVSGEVVLKELRDLGIDL